jgi:hypothetical protein
MFLLGDNGFVVHRHIQERVFCVDNSGRRETDATWYFGVFSLSASAGSGKEKLIVLGVSGQSAGSFRGVLEKGVSAGQNMAVADEDAREGKGASFPGGDPFPFRSKIFAN